MQVADYNHKEILGWILVLFFWIFMFTPEYALALPEGGEIVAGQGSIHQPTPQDLTINQNTNNLIINWQGFSIGSQQSVQFIQPDVNSVALNRVVGTDPSRIAGRLSANGQVFITNPSGVIFLPGSQVDVHGLLATTLGISDQDFLNRTYNFFQDPGKSLASILNEGNISGSYVGLLAPSVTNRGTIIANLGSVGLVSGEAVSMDFIGDGLINFVVDQEVLGTVTDLEGNAIDTRVSNEGLIQADGGQVILLAKDAGSIIRNVVNQSGIIEARTVIEKEGKIFLSGGDHGVVSVSGVLDASGDDEEEKGGTVHVTGENIGLFGEAKIMASGYAGGGEVLFGGGLQGKGEIPNATATFIGENTSIHADALKEGDGGKIIVFAEDTARIFGRLSARGGPISGNGGFVETSGKKSFEILRTPDIGASNGTGGEWLIDPFNVEVVPGLGNININATSPFQSTLESAQLGIELILRALNGFGSVTITTGAGGVLEAGNIIWNAPLDYNGINNNALSLFANGSITFNQNIFDSVPGDDRLDLQFFADSDNNGSGDFVVANGVSLNSGNGIFTIQASDINLNPGSLLTSGGGRMQILATNGGTIGLDGAAASGTVSAICGGLACGMTLSGGELQSLVAHLLRIGNATNADISVDGISAAQSANIDLVDFQATDPLASVNFVNNASTFNSLKALAGADINIDAPLNILGAGAVFANILLIEDQGGFGNAGTILTEDGHTVTIINDELANGRANLTDLAFLSQFDFVVWGARGDGNQVSLSGVIPQAVLDTLDQYIVAGGNLLVTGVDTLGFPADPGLANLVRSSTSGDLASFDPNWQTTAIDNFILNGAIGDFRNVSFTGIGADDDLLTADATRGAVTLATSALSERIIFTSLAGGGSVGYWNGGLFGQLTNAQPEFSDRGIPQDIFRNWSSGQGTNLFFQAQAGGAININGTLNATNSAFTGGIFSMAASNGINITANVTSQGPSIYDAGAGVFSITGVDVTSTDSPITVIATDFAIASTLNSGTASTTLLSSTPGASFSLGAGPGTFSILDSELDNILASGGLFIGDASTGPIDINGVSSTTPVTLTTGSSVTFSGADSTFSNLTINAAGDIILNTSVSTPDVNQGNFTAVADTDGNAIGDVTIASNSTISAAGDISLTGTNINQNGTLDAGGAVNLVGNVQTAPPPPVIPPAVEQQLEQGEQAGTFGAQFLENPATAAGC